MPDGVELRELTPNADERGVFTEILRVEWGLPSEFVQWNAVSSRAKTLRGVHVHPRHWDYLVMAAGTMRLGLADLRPESPTHGLACCLELRAEAPCAGIIPPGVAHGFYFPEDSVHIYGVSHYWDTADELGCRWDDPEMAIPWGEIEPRFVSERDLELPSLGELAGPLATARRELNR